MGKIFIIGFMASGKSTIGELLAMGLKAQFLDLDDLLLRHSGLSSVNDIFDKSGEKKFREIESKTLRSVAGYNVVCACGGGTPCFGENMDYLLAKGTVIYLALPASELYLRLRKEQHTRPLIRYMDEESLMVFVEALLQEREIFYSKAHITINAMGTPQKIVAQIRDALNKFQAR